MICLCTVELDFSKPIVGNAFKENQTFMRDIVDWFKIAKHIYIWDYTVNFGNYPDVYPNVRTIAENLRFFHRSGVRHMLEQGAGQPSHAWFADLKSYVISELEWNPEQDLDALIARFFAAIYGAGAPFVRAYYDACCKAYARDEAKEPMIFNPGLGRNAVPDSFYEEMAGLWAQAAAAVKGDSVREGNVRWGTFWNDYTRALLAARKAGVFISRHPERFDPARVAETKKTVNRVMDVVRRNPQECFYEADSENDMLEFERYLSAGSPTGPCDSAVFEENAVKLPYVVYGKVEDDPAALNGKAIRRYGKSYDWSGGFYLKGIVFDEGGKYAVRLRVRANLVPGANPDAQAFTAGVYSHAFKSAAIRDLRVRCADVKDADYHWYETAAWVPRKGDFLWFTPGVYNVKKGETNAVSDVWFDCFEVVRKDVRE